MNLTQKEMIVVLLEQGRESGAFEALEELADVFGAIVDKAQNGPPDGEGDGSFGPGEWEAARDMVAGLRAFLRLAEAV